MPPPTKRGTLAKTPLVHLLVYSLEHRLTGSMLLGPSNATPPTGIYLHEGAPDRLVTPDSVVTPGSELRRQQAEQIRHLFHLPPETAWAYYANLDLWPDREPFEGSYEPLSWVVLGVRLRTDEGPIDAALDKLGESPLHVHPTADAHRLGFNPREQAVLERLRPRPVSLPELLADRVATERDVRTVVYSLLVTRHVDLTGAGRDPVGMKKA
jgi:hypothetical protein